MKNNELMEFPRSSKEFAVRVYWCVDDAQYFYQISPPLKWVLINIFYLRKGMVVQHRKAAKAASIVFGSMFFILTCFFH